MPWTVKDVEEKIGGLSDAQKNVWVRVANGALQRCLDKGGNVEKCEASAIRQAHAVAKKAKEFVEDDVETIINYNEDEDTWTVEHASGTYSKLDDVEIFAVGQWNGDHYNESDLDAMVEAFDALKDRWTPVLKRGHQEQQEQPALGYITSLCRKGKKLVASLENLPKIVYNAIKRGLFKRVSAEIYWNYMDTEKKKKFPRVLKAVALLGSSIPAVSGLKELDAFMYSEEEENVDNLRIYEEVVLEDEKTSDKEFVTKTDGGKEYPASAYLYVPDPEKSSTWKLRVWETPKAKVTKTQLGRAAAALSSGGFRGNRVQLPAKDRAKVIDKLKSLYRKLGVTDEEMPRHLNIDENDKEVNSDMEKLLKELQAKVEELETKIKEYDEKKEEKAYEEFETELTAAKEELENMKAYVAENEELKAKTKEYKAELEEKDRQLDLIADEKRQDAVKAYVESKSVRGTKQILPKSEDLVKEILLACPDKKEYSLEEDGEKLSLTDMVKMFIESLTEQVDLQEKTDEDDGKEKKSYTAVDKEVADKTAQYREEHPELSFTQAMKTVLAEDEELKERYHAARTNA